MRLHANACYYRPPQTFSLISALLPVFPPQISTKSVLNLTSPTVHVQFEDGPEAGGEEEPEVGHGDILQAVWVMFLLCHKGV